MSDTQTNTNTRDELATAYAVNKTTEFDCPACGEGTMWTLSADDFKAGYDAGRESMAEEVYRLREALRRILDLDSCEYTVDIATQALKDKSEMELANHCQDQPGHICELCDGSQATPASGGEDET